MPLIDKKKPFIIFIVCAFILSFVQLYFDDMIPDRSVQSINVEAENNFDKTLKVVAEDFFAPYSFINDDGNPDGYGIELINALGNELGYNIEFEFMNRTACIEAVKSGYADIYVGIGKIQGIREELCLSYPIQNDNFICFGEDEYSSVFELYDKTIAVKKDDALLKEQLVPYTNLENVKVFNTYEEAMDAVISGQCDYAFLRYNVGKRIVIEKGVYKIRSRGEMLSNGDIMIAASYENADVIKNINKTFISLMEEGTVEKLSEKWINNYKTLLSIGDVIYFGRTKILNSFIVAFIITMAFTVIENKRKQKMLMAEKNEMERIQEYQNLIVETTKSLYKSVYEFDITNKKILGGEGEKYFEQIGVKNPSSYEEVFNFIVENNLKKEFIGEFTEAFSIEGILKRFESGINKLNIEVMFTANGFSYRWFRLYTRTFLYKRDKTIRLIVFMQDINDEKKKVEILYDKMQKDPLTLIYNKVVAETLIKGALLSKKSSYEKAAFVMLDVDNFKYINDTFGHASGDEVIRLFAQKLKNNIRSTDILGRFGGDEFMILLSDIHGEDILKKKLKNINDILSEAIEINGIEYKTSASIGAALFGTTRKYEDIFNEADKALYESKEKGKDCYTIHIMD